MADLGFLAIGLLRNFVLNRQWAVVADLFQSSQVVLHSHVAITERLRPPLREWLRSLPPTAERLFDLSPRGVDYVVEACGHRAGLRPGGKLTPQHLRDSFALRELAMLVVQERELEASGADAAQVDQARREHDVRLLRQLGLSVTGQVAQRYRAALAAQEQRQQLAEVPDGGDDARARATQSPDPGNARSL